MDRRRARFWVETIMAALSGLLVIVTLISHDWIETLFGVDPDSGSGALEWWIVALALVVTIACASAAMREWRRSAA